MFIVVVPPFREGVGRGRGRREKWVKEIRYYQSGGGATIPLIRQKPFHRLVKELMEQESVNSTLKHDGAGNPHRVKFMTGNALRLLQDTLEAWLVDSLADAYLLTIHSRRVTLMPRDFRLSMRLKKERGSV